MIKVMLVDDQNLVRKGVRSLLELSEEMEVIAEAHPDSTTDDPRWDCVDIRAVKGRHVAVIRAYPGLRVCVPHLGADEFDSYCRLLERYDNLWLDTTMTLADYLPMDYFPELMDMRVDRIIFGTDFPNLPYAWDREIRRLIELKLPESALERILGKNAMEFYAIK